MTLQIIHTVLLAGAVEGVSSGQLTPRETAHIEHHKVRINHEVRRDHAMNGGHLTPAEHAKVTQQQNRASSQVLSRLAQFGEDLATESVLRRVVEKGELQDHTLTFETSRQLRQWIGSA